MVTKSGIVLDYDTNLGISGAVIHVYTVTGTNILTSGVCSPVGTFSIDIPDSVSSNLIYIPVKYNYRGYSRQFDTNVSFLNLFLRSVIAPISVNTVNLNLYNTGLVTSVQVRDIVSTPTHYYIITDNGLDVIDANTLYNVAYSTRSGGYTSIALDRNISTSSGVYLGTESSGVYTFNIPNEYDLNDRDISSLIGGIYTLTSGNILSNNIECLHLNSRGELGVGTLSGIDFYTISGRKSHTYVSWTGTNAIFVSDYGDLYYAPTNSGLHVKYGSIGSNWTNPDYYVILSGTGPNPFPLLSNYINDISITSISGDQNNCVFVATESGLMYYQEDSNLNISASGAKLIRSIP